MKLYPEPQLIEIKGRKIDLENIRLTCREKAAKDISIYNKTAALFKGKNEIEIYKRHIMELPEQYIRQEFKINSSEAYAILISEANICIYCSDDRTFYYGILDIVSLLKGSELYEGFIYNYPDMKIRGIIEGFYGKPWRMDERLDSIKTISEHKMNTYIYAPKDDPYHREKWYKPYPSEEIEKIKKLYDHSRENYIDFIYSVSPGLSMKYSDEKDFSCLASKYLQVYELGVRNFAIMFDDIPLKLMNKNDMLQFSELADAHIYIVGRLYDYLKKLDPSVSLIVCPTEYFGRGNEKYIVKLGKGIPEGIDIFWTGRAICSRELDTRDARYFYENTGHMPLYWDNYPVNDADMINEMHLGPFINRDSDLYTFSRGLVSNLMEYKESSMIPIITAAHYLWNSKGYNSNESLRAAVQEIAGAKDCEDLMYFIKYCSKSCISITPCEEFLEEMAHCQFLLINGSPVRAIYRMQRFFSRNLKKGCAILNMENDKLLCEIKPWIEKYICFNKLCLEAIKCRKMKIVSYKKYIEMKKRTMEYYEKFKANPLEMMNVEANMIINSLLND